MAFIHKKFRFLVSPGTIYSLLYSLERDGLIEGRWNQRKRVYTLTRKGKETIKLILESSEKIHRLIMDIFGDK
jgi:DNA-binding PadR family transcriptional regulator